MLLAGFGERSSFTTFRPHTQPKLSVRVLETVVGTEGRLVGLSTLDSTVDERLESAAPDAVLQRECEPRVLNGQPDEVPETLSVAFEMP